MNGIWPMKNLSLAVIRPSLQLFSYGGASLSCDKNGPQSGLTNVVSVCCILAFRAGIATKQTLFLLIIRD